MVNSTGLKWMGIKSIKSIKNLSYLDMFCHSEQTYSFFEKQNYIANTYKENQNFLVCYSHSDNSKKIVLDEKYLLRDKDKNIMGIVSHFKDITNYKIIDLSLLITKKF